MSLQTRIESAITTASGATAVIVATQICYGGSINDSRIITLSDGRRLFVKHHQHAAKMPAMFAMEHTALNLLAAPDVIKVVQPVCHAEDFIVLEAFSAGQRRSDWLESMGRQLAQLHQATCAGRCGFAHDNYIGSTLQPNGWYGSWLEFWREQRLGFQLRLFAGKTRTDDTLLQLGDKLMTRLDDLLAGVDEPAVLLHGDLWSGNVAADAAGEPIIYDPASYYGQREAELAMMRMFGGFGPRCEAAYEEVWPLAAGAAQRISLYRLYHELNHLNLFGRSYYDSCLSTIKSLL